MMLMKLAWRLAPALQKAAIKQTAEDMDCLRLYYMYIGHSLCYAGCTEANLEQY
jgi:hypothetical protein